MTIKVNKNQIKLRLINYFSGILEQNEDKFRLVVDEKKRASDHVIWHNSRLGAVKNGFSGRKIHVKVLSEKDGRLGVVALTKQLCISDNVDFSVDTLDASLRKNGFEFPDPDLGICCGKTFSLFGYPPWQIRVTEFFTLCSHYGVTLDTFVNLLEKYNQCEQRYGK